MNAKGELAQLVNRDGELGGRSCDKRLGCCRVGPDSRAKQAKLHSERDEPLLRTVVQVAFEPAALLIAGADDPRPRRAQLTHARPQLSPQSLVCERDSGGGDNRLEQLSLVRQRGVVDDRSNTLTVLLHHC